MRIKPCTLAALVVAVLTLAPISASGGAGEANKNPSKEERAKMAALHEKMAACLRSERSVDECQTEMHAGVQQQRAGQAAPQAGGRDKDLEDPDVRSGAAKRHSDLEANSES